MRTRRLEDYAEKIMRRKKVLVEDEWEALETTGQLSFAKGRLFELNMALDILYSALLAGGEAAPEPPKEELTFEVVVNGQPVTITIAASVNVRAVIEPALTKTGAVSRADSEWEVRLRDGEPLYLDQPIAAYVGQRLWINLRAGYAAEGAHMVKS